MNKNIYEFVKQAGIPLCFMLSFFIILPEAIAFILAMIGLFLVALNLEDQCVLKKIAPDWFVIRHIINKERKVNPEFNRRITTDRREKSPAGKRRKI